jgi:hypothetical protein
LHSPATHPTFTLDTGAFLQLFEGVWHGADLGEAAVAEGFSAFPTTLFSVRSNAAMEDIACPSCKTVNPNDAFVCQNCQVSLVIGKLTSNGKGVLPKGFVLEMRNKELTLGRHVSNEFVIPSNLIARRQLRFHPTSYGFAVEDAEKRGRCSIDEERLADQLPLRDGMTLKIGVEEFVYNYLEPTGGKAKVVKDPLAAHLQLMLGVISEFHASLNLQEVFDNAVDAIMRLTGTKRGYAFLLEEGGGGSELREVAARAAGGKALQEDPTEGYTISQSMIQRVMGGNESIIIEDAVAQQAETETMVRFKLKSVVAVPLVTYNYKTGKRSVMGVIYADSLMPTSGLPKHSRPTLQLLAQILTSTIIKWQNFDKMESHFRTIEQSVGALEGDLELTAQSLAVAAQTLQDPGQASNVARELTQMSTQIEQLRAQAERLQSVRLTV